MEKFPSHKCPQLIFPVKCFRCLFRFYVFILVLGVSPIMSSLSTVIDARNNTAEEIMDIWNATGGVDETLPNKGWECNCVNATAGLGERELRCACQGDSVVKIPQILPTGMQHLIIQFAGLEILRNNGLKNYSSTLLDISLRHLNNFKTVQAGAFESIENLRTIAISYAPQFTYLGKEAFRGISSTLKHLSITNCGLTNIPDMTYLQLAKNIVTVDFEGNRITSIKSRSVKIKTGQLILDNNELVSIEDSAFYGSKIPAISIKGNNQLKYIHSSAFIGIKHLEELDLSNTALIDLPSNGLQNLEKLTIRNTHSLKTIPSIYNFKNLQVAYLTHSFHCCAFKYPARHDPLAHAKRLLHLETVKKYCMVKETSIGEDSDNLLLNNVENYTNSKKWRKRSLQTNHINKNDDIFFSHFEENFSHSNSTDVKSSYENIGQLGQFHEANIDIQQNMMDSMCGNLTIQNFDVRCYPMPDALNPCEDVMGSYWLRISVWVVVLLAVFGNVAVLVVLLANKSEASVPKFLMCHLAFADLCMGLYLLLIASIDSHSMGEYFNYAFDWQYGSGCKVAGFLTVFASHLSVFTLTIITLERWFAITHAIYLNKRIKIKPATYIMIGGWIYSSCMSAFPLFGISNYSSTSICLPMEARDSWDVVYLVGILGINGTAFFVIAICYAQIYFSLGKETRRAAGNASSGELTVAKKMALLVFTNFSCWAPIVFFGFTALAGYPLINVTKSKILLVFFYPLNSCADPYLYAILTAQYRRDLYTLFSKFGLCSKKAQQYKNSNYSLPGTNVTYPVAQHNSLSQNNQKSSEESHHMLSEDFV